MTIVLHDAARLGSVAVEGDLAVLDFAVNEGEWGVNDSVALRTFLEQVVYTATDEKSVYKTPLARPDHSVAYFARDLDLPVAVFLEARASGLRPRNASGRGSSRSRTDQRASNRTPSTWWRRCVHVCGR